MLDPLGFFYARRSRGFVSNEVHPWYQVVYKINDVECVSVDFLNGHTANDLAFKANVSGDLQKYL